MISTLSLSAFHANPNPSLENYVAFRETYVELLPAVKGSPRRRRPSSRRDHSIALVGICGGLYGERVRGSRGTCSILIRFRQWRATKSDHAIADRDPHKLARRIDTQFSEDAGMVALRRPYTHVKRGGQLFIASSQGQ